MRASVRLAASQMKLITITSLIFFHFAVAGPQPVSVTILNEKNTAVGVNGRLQTFMSTSFHVNAGDFEFFNLHPGATGPLWRLAPQHIRVQPVGQATPLQSPDQW